MKLKNNFLIPLAVCLAISIAGCGVKNASPLSISSEKSSQRILFVSNQDGNREIYTVLLDGSSLERLTHNTRDDYEASWSPDGKAILFTSNRDNGNSEIYVMNADGSQQTNLSKWKGFDGQPAWSPDGQHIVFVSDRSGPMQLYSINKDGRNLHQLTTDEIQSCDSPVYSPDGKMLAYRKLNERAKGDLWVLNLSDMRHRQLTNNPGYEDSPPRWSPDGQSLVYDSRRERQYNIYRYDLQTNKESQLTHLHTSDIQPVWSNSGEYISFLSTRGPHGRTQLYIMREDGSDQTSITDGLSQVDNPTWFSDESRMLLVSWQGNWYSNVYVVDLESGALRIVVPAKGYQSQPLPEPVLLPLSHMQSTRQVASNRLQ
ncbi:DUF5050 domain-containing protein [Aliiglaciecola sp. CAU 1673]|uniref:TolB family protein n=1 Tax=Aliiglaciecola sp. CAU 1673 TaxID=3032595 RepID=UPI0023DA6132|nr:DUF5050 domain-containing protein [Aliiglaciecola sp. CAU 1673]MDF2177049.1 DUF5050 domain-containing protein [Aliiglaciecola sp. CAU 1673]